MPEDKFGNVKIALRHREGDVKKNHVSVVYDDATGRPIVPGYTMVGHASIGVGRNLEARGISTIEKDFLFANDINKAVYAAQIFAGGIWANLCEVRQFCSN